MNIVSQISGLWDVHMHSQFSGDSQTPQEAMIRSAIEKGLSGICFTDHLDIDYPEEPGLFLLDLPNYTSSVSAYQETYASKIPILLGVELGLQPHLAGLHQIVQSLHGFFDGRVIVKAVDDIQIEIIRSQPLQSPVDLPVNCPGGQPAGIEIDLGGNDHLVAGDVLFQCPPQIFLAGSGRVAIGGIKKVDFQRKCVFDHFLCFCFIQRPVVHGPCLAEAHAADTQLGDLNIRIS